MHGMAGGQQGALMPQALMQQQQSKVSCAHCSYPAPLSTAFVLSLVVVLLLCSLLCLTAMTLPTLWEFNGFVVLLILVGSMPCSCCCDISDNGMSVVCNFVVSQCFWCVHAHRITCSPIQVTVCVYMTMVTSHTLGSSLNIVSFISPVSNLCMYFTKAVQLVMSADQTKEVAVWFTSNIHIPLKYSLPLFVFLFVFFFFPKVIFQSRVQRSNHWAIPAPGDINIYVRGIFVSCFLKFALN